MLEQWTLSVTDMTMATYLACTAVSLLAGLLIAFIYTRKTTYTQSIVITLIILPVLVQTVIMLVNGNLGTGVAVAGAFSLVRFRSVPGNAKDIAVIFLAMTVGLATGTGSVGIALVSTAVACLVIYVLTVLNVGGNGKNEKELKITIPESLDYAEVFDDIFSQYTTSVKLVEVKTSNMGSLYKLNYHVALKDPTKEKDFIDKLRVRNGNLEVSCGRIVTEEAL